MCRVQSNCRTLDCVFRYLPGSHCPRSRAHPAKRVPSIGQDGIRRRHILIGKNLEITPEFREYFQSKLEKLDRLLPTFSDQLVSLQATVEKNLKCNEYSTTFSLHLTQGTLHAEGQSRDLKAEVCTAFDGIIQQVDRLKSKLRGEHRWAAGRPEVNF